MSVFCYIGILDTSNRKVVTEKPKRNETSVPSEQLLPVKEVSEEKRVVFFYSSIITSYICEYIMNQNILSFTICH